MYPKVIPEYLNARIQNEIKNKPSDSLKVKFHLTSHLNSKIKVKTQIGLDKRHRNNELKSGF